MEHPVSDHMDNQLEPAKSLEHGNNVPLDPNVKSILDLCRAFASKGVLLQDFMHRVSNCQPGFDMWAVTTCGLCLKYVKDPTPETIAAAVRENPDALQFVKPEDQTVELCLEAIKARPESRQYVKIPLPDLGPEVPEL
jgi:hypothetical protein